MVGVDLRFQNANIGHVPVLLAVIQPIAHHKFVGHGKAGVIRADIGQAALRLDTQWVSADAGADWTAADKTGPLFKPIGAAAERAVPVECYIPEGGVTADGETQIAAVTYTVGISGAAGDGG